MKIGLEVEGTHIGMPTLFCDANDLPKISSVFNDLRNQHFDVLGNKKLSSIYISDPSNIITCNDLIGLPNVLITLEITDYKLIDRPSNVIIMLRNPTFSNVKKLKLSDMIKFEFEKKVFVFSMYNAIITYPHEFDKDVKIHDSFDL